MGIAGQTLIILDGRGLTFNLREDITAAYRQYHISDELEYFYDWMLMEGFRQAICMSIREHRFTIEHLDVNHLYRAIFDEIGPMIVSVIKDFIAVNQLSFLAHNRVKMMITYNDIVIVRYS